jgi:Excalibur calcium-binding domain/Protein of unknown function (DUF1524)
MQWAIGLVAVLTVLIVTAAIAPTDNKSNTPSAAETPPTAATRTDSGAGNEPTTTVAPTDHATPTATATGSTNATTPEPTATPPGRSPSAGAGTALAALAELPVKGRAPKTGYSREQFGGGWASVAGCDTRDRILARDLTSKTLVPGGGCRVQTGLLDDPYTAETVRFVRGGASEVDIDHVVALGDAWQKGAQQWSASRRVAFANDPLNLLAVAADANRAKGDGDAATWLPPNKRFRCAYVARQIAVKRKYQAWVTRAEHDAMARVLGPCPGEKLPQGGVLPGPAVPAPAAPAQAATPRRHQAATPHGTGSGHGRVFANCAAVRAAGLAPLRRGTPDYDANPHLDRDKDGLACE